MTPEIRRERNTILQCIRHIVKKNFFGIEGPTSSTETNNEAKDDIKDVAQEEYTDDKHLQACPTTVSKEDNFSSVVDNLCIK